MKIKKKNNFYSLTNYLQNQNNVKFKESIFNEYFVEISGSFLYAKKLSTTE